MLGTDKILVRDRDAGNIQVKKEIVAYSKEEKASQHKIEHDDENEEVYYNRFSDRQRGEGSYRRNRGRRRQNWRGRQRSFNSSSRRGTNPASYDGNPSTCFICGSINHWARECTEKAEEYNSNQETYLISHNEPAEYTLMATTDEKLNNLSLLGETVGCVVL